MKFDANGRYRGYSIGDDVAASIAEAITLYVQRFSGEPSAIWLPATCAVPEEVKEEWSARKVRIFQDAKVRGMILIRVD